jgi:hypothetical protein
MMNDATLRQMAAAKTMANNDNHMSRALLGRLHIPVCSTPTEAPWVNSRGVLKPNYFDVQLNQNDESQRASEHREFRFAAWTTRRLIGQFISVGHKKHPSPECSFVSKHPRWRPGVQAEALLHRNLLRQAQQLDAGFRYCSVRL